MKILHISTSNRSGTGIAALRQHKALLQAGMESKFLCLSKKGAVIPEVYVFPRPSHGLFLKGLRKLGVYHTQADKHQKVLSKLSGKYKIFTFPRTDFNLLEHTLIQEADIINLHWVANFLDWLSFFKGINKPVVWTLHDMNPFQGGFHYEEVINRNVATFGSLGNRLKEIKNIAICKFDKLTVVGLTKWLKQVSEESDILGRFPHRLIQNRIDLNIFKPIDQHFAREVFDLP